MAHKQQADFCLRVKNKFPSFFENTKVVLDVGSLDINGSNKTLFAVGTNYTGIDLAPGKNVDAISKGHEWGAPDNHYDTIISTECFEHDMFYEKTFQNIIRMLKPGGLFLFTCATTGRPEHGTRRTTSKDSPFTSSISDWEDYYKNLTELDVRAAIDVDLIFSTYHFEVGREPFDLYFYGVT